MLGHKPSEPHTRRTHKAATHRPITKTDFLSGLQCRLHLWNRHHAPIPYEDRDETIVMRAGTSIGELARALFPNGVLVGAQPWERDQSVERTNTLIADESVPAIFEAGFSCNGLHVRIDVLKRKHSGKFAVYEVKSTGEVKDHHLPDVAFQVYVARRSGLDVDEAGIIYINKSYVRGDEIEPKRLFTLARRTAAVEKQIQRTARRIRTQHRVVAGDKPIVPPGGHCGAPYLCEFWDRCTAKKPPDWVFYLPALSSRRYAELQKLGIESIRRIPDNFSLSEKQARVRDVLRARKPFFDSALRTSLAELSRPTCYMDFETISPSVPLWKGTRPFERIPFQWSVHRENSQGQIEHSEFLADGVDDPRRAFAQSLIEQIGFGTERVVVYNQAFEAGILRDLITHLPSLARPLSGISERLWDLLPVIRSHVYHQDFAFSFSIKTVAPALAPQISYAELNGVSDGETASNAFLKLVTGSCREDGTSRQIRDNLLAYCKVDTLAMLQVHKTLREICQKT